jgi:hypothetical protein
MIQGAKGSRIQGVEGNALELQELNVWEKS